MAGTGHWETSIDDLVAIFAGALRALTPFAERAKMHWREPDNYDDWDDMAIAIYQSFVRGSIEYSSGFDPLFPIPPYDQRIGSYQNNSFISDAVDGTSPFVCLETSTSPFDTALFKVIDVDGRVIDERRKLLADASLILILRSASGVSTLKSITVAL